MSTPAIVLICAAYFVPLVFAWRMVAGHLAWKTAKHWKQKEPDGGDWAGAMFCGFFVAALWPVALLWAWTPWTIGEERRVQLRKAEKRIRELEKILDDEA